MSATPNKAVRARAVDLFRTHWLRILLLTLVWSVAPFLSGCVSVAFTRPGQISAFAGNLLHPDQDLALTTFTSTIGVLPVIAGAAFALISVLSSVLHIGYLRGLMQLDAGETPEFSVLWSRWRNVPGCIGLTLWVALKTLLWALPGIVMMLMGMAQNSLGMMNLGDIFIPAGCILALALGSIAQLRYALAPYVFAENPEIGVFGAVKRSKYIMSYRKWQLFCLPIPWALILAGIWLGVLLLFGYLLAVAADVSPDLMWFQLSADLVLLIATACVSMLSQLAVACYYNAHK